MIIVVLALFLVPFAFVVGLAVLVFWCLVWFAHAGRGTAITLSVAVAVLSLPMVVSGHGVDSVPLALGAFSGKATLMPWAPLVGLVAGVVAYLVLRRVWEATVYEPE
jgi:hypothetical protein